MQIQLRITLLLLICVLVFPSIVTAHPMGNFSVSHYSGLRIKRDAVELRYIIDMAEIPTFQEIQETGIVPKVGDASLEGYLSRKADLLGQGLILEVNGRRLQLHGGSKEIIFPAGAGGLEPLQKSTKAGRSLPPAPALTPLSRG